jgi:hypothetical protein
MARDPRTLREISLQLATIYVVNVFFVEHKTVDEIKMYTLNKMY